MIYSGEVTRESIRRPDAQKAQRWFASETPHAEVFALVRRLEAEQQWRFDELAEHRFLYDNGGAKTGREYGAGKRGVSFNVARSLVHTVCSRIAKNRPRPLFLTTNGNWKQQRKARKLTTYTTGVFHHAKTYKAMQHAFKDAAIGHFGAVRFYAEHGAIRSERVMPDELLIDEREARYGEPRSIHQRRIIDRDVLSAMFPEFEEAIAAANSPPSNKLSSRLTLNRELVDAVEVIESWRLPSAPDAGDGVHSICLEGTTLLREEYKHSRFPFVFLYWERPDEGFCGTGVIFEVKAVQYEIARILRTIQVAQSRLAVGKTFVERGSKVDDSQLTNEPGAIVHYTGTKPSVDVSPSVHPEVYQHLDRLERKAYELVGVSQMSAQSQKPAGLDSGAALRTYQDVETERFVLYAQRYEEAYVEAAEIVVMLSRDLYEDGDVTVRAPGRKFVETIRWSEVDLTEDQYVLEIFPVSRLPQTPEGRLAFVGELEQKGYLTREQALMLLDYPDLERFTSTLVAPVEATEALIDKMLDEKTPLVPEPYMNLDLCKRMAQATYLRAKANDELDEEQLELLRVFMDQTAEMIENARNDNAGGAPGVDPSALGGGPAPGPGPGGPGGPGGGIPPELAGALGAAA